MKKPFYKNYLFWIMSVAVIAAGIFFSGAGRSQIIYSAGMSAASSTENEQSVKNDSNGYAFNVPSDWYVEHSGENTVVVYPDYSPSISSLTPTCKIEMSVFPYASSTSISNWISQRLRADPTIDVIEQSSENISIPDASAIKWIGTMNGITTTLVYAFNKDHAYEIAPSVLEPNATCDDSLGLFLQTLII